MLSEAPKVSARAARVPDAFTHREPVYVWVTSIPCWDSTWRIRSRSPGSVPCCAASSAGVSVSGPRTSSAGSEARRRVTSVTSPRPAPSTGPTASRPGTGPRSLPGNGTKESFVMFSLPGSMGRLACSVAQRRALEVTKARDAGPRSHEAPVTTDPRDAESLRHTVAVLRGRHTAGRPRPRSQYRVLAGRAGGKCIRNGPGERPAAGGNGGRDGPHGPSLPQLLWGAWCPPRSAAPSGGDPPG